MASVVIPLLFIVGLAVIVCVVAAIAARRQGHDLLAPQGEAAVAEVRMRSRRAVDGSRRAVDGVVTKLRSLGLGRREKESSEVAPPSN